MMLAKFKSIFTNEPDSSKPGPVAHWAAMQGLTYLGPQDQSDFALSGTTSGKSWRLECGAPTRDFIQGKELLACAVVDIPPDVSVLIVNRALKDELEDRAYNLYTQSNQTKVGQNLPVEMRWLAMYEETGWNSLPQSFWEKYAVVAEEREHAAALLDSNLAELLMSWPNGAWREDTPFILMLRRGKAYLRMQYTPADLATLEHAAVIFTTACDIAVAELGASILL